MKFVIGGTLTILSWDNPVTAFFRKSKKLRHSLGRPSRSDFVQFHFLGIEKSGGVNKVNIKIDASRVAGLITGSANLDKVVYDTWYLKDVELMSGKIYGLVSEYGQGCMYLSYLLGGKIDFGDLQIFIDGINVSKEDLKSISWNLEPSKEKYKNKTVRKSIEKSIIKNKCSDTFEDIVEAFYLDERRHVHYSQVSGHNY